jgi:hypothetical protein
MDNWLSFLTAVSGIFLIFALTGCTHQEHITVVKPPLTISDAMFQCEDSGNRPTGEVIMESEVARYISTLELANKDCKTQLKELQVVIKCYNDKDCNVDKLVEYVGLVRQEKTR